MAAPETSAEFAIGLPVEDDNLIVAHPESLLLHDELDRVVAKENAWNYAMSQLQQIAMKLQDMKSSVKDMDFTSWVSRIDTMKQEGDSISFLVGTAGDTGVGKSSLLNAIISEKADVVPSSQNGACTAAVCCISYPRSEDALKPFSAKIHMKSKETVDQELTAFFQEMGDFEERARVDACEDPTTHGEREKFHDRLALICRWSGCSEQQLREYGHNNLAQEITNNCKNGEQVFNFSQPQNQLVIRVSSNNEEELRSALRPYVGSSGRNTPMVLWPLVELVEVFVKADILRGGIVLVDLPGEMDALEARSQIARKYYNKLDQLMVVTPGDRAADNRTAMDLIREDQIMDMEADGKLNDSTLGIVVTKIDQMEWQVFVESEWPTSEVPAGLQEAKGAIETKGVLAESLEKYMDELNERFDGEDVDINIVTNHLNDARKQRKRVADEIQRLQSFCLRKCIEARSQDIKKAFQLYFDRVCHSMGNKQNQKAALALPVFPVSSRAYRYLSKGRRASGFSDRSSTGIEAVKEWIIKASLSRREEHADNMIRCCQVLFDAIGSWALDEVYTELKVPQTELLKVCYMLRNARGHLEQDISRMNESFYRYLYDLQTKSRLFRPDTIEHLLGAFVGYVDKFQQGTDGTGASIHWSTYAACIRRRGGVYRTYTKPRRIHCWQARIHGLLWAPYAMSWGQSFGQKLIDKTRAFEGHIQRRTDLYIANVSNSADFPEQVKVAFRNCAYKVQNFVGEYQTWIRTSVSQYRNAAKQIKHNSSERLAEHMKDAYFAAQNVTAPGMHKKQTAIMRMHAENMKNTLFRTITSEVDANIRKHRLALNKALKYHGDRLLGNIKWLEVNMINEIFNQSQKPRDTSFYSTDVSCLKETISEDVKLWRQCWAALRARLPQCEIPEDQDFVASLCMNGNDGGLLQNDMFDKSNEPDQV